MSTLGHPVVYTVLDAHKTSIFETIEEKVIEIFTGGSVHHPEMTEFAGLIGAENADGTCDLVIFVPNKEPRWVENVAEGNGSHSFRLFAHEPEDLQAAGGDVSGAVADAKTAAAAATAAASNAASSASSAGSSASNAASSASNAASSATAAAASASEAKAAIPAPAAATVGVQPPAATTAGQAADTTKPAA